MQWSDSGIKGPAYSSILADMDRLAAQHGESTRLIEYGKSVKGRPLRMLVVAKPVRRAGRTRPTLFMSGSTHGNEYLNIEDRLPEELLKLSRVDGEVKDFLDDGGAFVFVPILNPDGYEARRRENARGVDLNRDWDLEPAEFKGFKEKETRALATQLDSLSQGDLSLDYEVTIDYHCCIGALLHPWSYTKDKLAAAELARHQAVGELANQHLDLEIGATGEVLGYFPLGTTKDYYFVKYGAVAFTYEGRRNVENKYLPKHVAWWRSMVGHVRKEFRNALLNLNATRKPRPFPLFAD